MRLLQEIRNYMGDYHVKSGVYHYYRSEFKQAIAFLGKALNDEKKLSENDERSARHYLTMSHKGLALKLSAGGEIQAGLAELDTAAATNPSYPDLHFLRAGLLERLERSDEAIEAYREALERHPGYLEARVALGYCLLNAGEAGQAADVFRQALEAKLQRISEPFDRAIASLEGGDPEAARPWLHQVFMAAPALADEYLRKAVEWLRVEDYEKALADFDRAFELNPGYPDVCNFRGIALCMLEQYDAAAGAFRAAAALNPEHLVPRLNLAFTLVRAGKLREAEEEFESVLQKDPGEPVAAAKLEELRAGRLGARPGV